MINALIDHPRTDPDAPAPLAEPVLMPLRELIATHAAYERRILHDLIWHETTLTPDERAHAIAVEEQYRLYEQARLWTITHREVPECEEDWQMRHPIAPPTAAELAAMADEVPY